MSGRAHSQHLQIVIGLTASASIAQGVPQRDAVSPLYGTPWLSPREAKRKGVEIQGS